MKPGFGGKKNKAKKQKKVKGKKNADAPMDDARVMSSDDEIVNTVPKGSSVMADLSSKERHKSKVAQKMALKVKVANLKQARSKLTKIPGNKVQRKVVSEATQDALMELQELQKDKTQKKIAKKNKKKNKKNKRKAIGTGPGGKPAASAGAEAMEAD